MQCLSSPSADLFDIPYIPGGPQVLSRLMEGEAAASASGLNRDVNHVLTVGILDTESWRGTRQVQESGAQALASGFLTGVPHSDALMGDIRLSMVQHSVPQRSSESGMKCVKDLPADVLDEVRTLGAAINSYASSPVQDTGGAFTHERYHAPHQIPVQSPALPMVHSL